MCVARAGALAGRGGWRAAASASASEREQHEEREGEREEREVVARGERVGGRVLRDRAGPPSDVRASGEPREAPGERLENACFREYTRCVSV